jgi:hypothetical protein
MMAKEAYQHSTMPTTTSQQADRQWIEDMAERQVFGDVYTVDQQPVHFNHEDPIMNEIMQAILDDQAKGRPSISPFWMLSIV